MWKKQTVLEINMMGKKFSTQSFVFYDCLPGERQTEESYMIPEHRALGAKACHPDRAVGEWRDLVLAFGKARQTLLFAK